MSPPYGRAAASYHPFPMPESVKALSTLFKYAIAGPLWLASITSSAPDVRVCRHTAVTVEPAVTEMILSDGVVGFGPPLQARSLDVTSVIGPSYVGSRIAYDIG